MACIKGLIVAAGRSSRMGKFKPMLDFEGEPMIVRAVESMQEAGIGEICVVTGRERQKVEKAVEPLGAITVCNPHYASTGMFDSVKIGMEALGPMNAFFLLPGDMPLVRPETFQLLEKAWENGAYSLVYPVFENELAHPPLIGEGCFAGIFRHNGEEGLRGALRPFEPLARFVEVEDPGCAMDADYLEDYRKMLAYVKKEGIFSNDLYE
jgi:molybdenum cofactor cytidylyltransferase